MPATKDDSEKVEEIGAELKFNPPTVIEKTRSKYGPKVANKQRVAILLSKARRKGIKLPPRKTV